MQLVLTVRGTRPVALNATEQRRSAPRSRCACMHKHGTNTHMKHRRSVLMLRASQLKPSPVSHNEWETQLGPGARTVYTVVAPDAPPNSKRRRSTALTLVADPRLLTAQPTDRAPQPLDALLERWDALPSAYKVVFATSLAFVICNMDKVNMSVAIVPMAREFGWTASVAGLVQSAFFWGYALSQIPGGYLTSRIGGRTVLPGGVGLWSGATAMLPLLASSVPGLCFSRAAVGLGEAMAPSAATDMVSRVIDNSQRARAISFIFAGLHVGSLLGLLIAPVLIEQFGWPSVFYLFGGAGLAWCVAWEQLMGRIAEQDPVTAAKLYGPLTDGDPATADEDVPWRAILRSQPFWALAFTHFCNNWFHYTLLAWLPTYFTDSLSLDLRAAAQLSLLPPIAAIVVSGVTGTAADTLLARGVPVSLVRRLAQCTAFLTPAACLTAAALSEDGTSRVALITASLGMASFSLAGLYCNHADLSPKYAPLLLGCTNTAGAIPGIFGVALTGILLDRTDSWGVALFAPCVLLFVAGSFVFCTYASTERQDWSDNTPFSWEARWGLTRAWDEIAFEEQGAGGALPWTRKVAIAWRCFQERPVPAKDD